MSSFSYGFSSRKARFLAQFTGQVVRPLDDRRLSSGDTLYVWGGARPPAEANGAKLVHVEDGFLRSTGLGAAFAEPLSWCFDRSAPHYDGAQRTDLERLLAELRPDEALRRRSAVLRARIIENGLTKYNVGARQWSPTARSAKPSVLVVGQVADDAAMPTTGSVRSNLDLLRRVRFERPDAHILYKRHPDVSAGLRDGADEDALQMADEIVQDVALDAILPHVQEVHVITSLCGFEAILRGSRVICHGLPFYAGWGLTVDRLPAPRRVRRLELDELISGALILYPRYRRPGRGEPCEVEEVVEILAARTGARARPWQGLRDHAGRMAARLLRGMGGARGARPCAPGRE